MSKFIELTIKSNGNKCLVNLEHVSIINPCAKGGVNIYLLDYNDAMAFEENYDYIKQIL